jgi:Domain of unknown function (DUF4411)
MEPYWIDSNVFIDSATGPYPFKRAPTFWSFLDAKFNEGIMCTSEMVYRELAPYGDELSGWIKTGNRMVFIWRRIRKFRRNL